MSQENEVKQLRQSVKIVEKPETVSTKTKEIVQKISQVIGIPIEVPKQLNREVIREWRSMIVFQQSFINQKLELLERLEAKFPEWIKHRKELQEKLLKLEKKERLLSKLTKDYSNEKKKIETSEEKLRKLLLEERKLSSKKDDLNWLFQAKMEYQQLKEKITKENKNSRKIQTEMLELSPRIEKLQFKKEALEKAKERRIKENLKQINNEKSDHQKKAA